MSAVLRGPAGVVALFAGWVTLAPESVQDQWIRPVLGGLLALTGLTLWRVQSCIGARQLTLGHMMIWIGWALCSAAALLSICWATYPEEAWLWALRCVVPGVFIFCCAHQLTFRASLVLRPLLTVLSVACLLLALLGIYELVTQSNPLYDVWFDNLYYEQYRAEGRLMATRMHPSVLGFFLVAGLPAMLTLSRTRHSHMGKHLLRIGLGCLVMSLICTFSRGALFAASVSMICYATLTQRKRLVLWLGVILFASVIICSIAQSSQAPQPAQAPQALRRLSLTGLTSPSPYHYRMERVSIALRMARDHPWTGVGLNHFRLRFTEYAQHHRYPITENIFAALLAETGVIGCTGWMVFVIGLLTAGAHRIRAMGEGDDRLWFITAYCSLVGMLCNSLTYDTLYWTSSLSLFWLLTGVVTAELRKHAHA